MSNLTYTDVPIDLIVNKLSKEKYDSLVNANLINDTEIYLVDEDNLDAASGVISNVGTPVSPTDAANKSYVDTVSSNIVSAFPEIPANIVINNAGNNTASLAIGICAKVSGEESIAIGYCAYVSTSGCQSMAFGNNVSSTGSFSIATGYCAQATGFGSIAAGSHTQATRDYSIATGHYAKAAGEMSIATGYYAQTTGVRSIAIGNNVSATGSYSIATGYSAKAIGYDSIATGYNAKALSGDSIAIGCNANANNQDSLAIGANTQANGVGTIAIGSTYHCTFNPVIADANTPIVIGSGESAVSAAQIRVTKEGVMTVGGKEVGASLFETKTFTTDSQEGESDLMVIAKQENGVQPRLHAGDKDIHGVTGFSNESDKYTGQRYILDWDLAMSNDTSYLMGATKWTGSRRIGGNHDILTTTFVQPLIPANTGTTSSVLPYALPCFENSPVYWNGHIIWNNSLCTAEGCSDYGKYTAQAKDITIPWHNAGTDVSSIEFVVNNNKTDPAIARRSLAIGYCAKADLCHSVAVGPSVDATGCNAIAIGSYTRATRDHSIAIGTSVSATGTNSIATGYNAQATGTNSIATGCNVKAQDAYTIAIGASKSWYHSVSASTAVPIVIGSDHSSVSAAQITVTSAGVLNVGGNPVAMQSEIPTVPANIVINNAGNNTSNLAIGKNTTSSGSNSILIGNSVSGSGIAIGYDTSACDFSIAMGCHAKAAGINSIATGYNAQASSDYSIATGSDAQATGYYSITAGSYAQATNFASIATGYYAKATGERSIATGYNAQATGNCSIATGYYACAKDDYTIAIGASKSSSYSISASTAVPIVIGSDHSSVSAAQITVTSAGILNVGGVEMAKKSDALITIKRWDD